MDQKKRLVDGNATFRKTSDPAFLAELSKGQQPFVAILTCSDSRVVPERIFNLNLGDAFVVRVAGNSVADPGALGSLEYAT
jgi:carbonic anhydrase